MNSGAPATGGGKPSINSVDPAADAAKKQLVYEQLLKLLGEEEDRTG